MCLLALLQDRFASQDQVTLDAIWHAPSMGHLQQPSSSHFHYSKNTSPHPLVLKETNSVWDLTSPDAPLALDEKLGRDSAQTPGSRTDQLSTWQIYQHCTSCLEAGNPKTVRNPRAAAGWDDSRAGSQANSPHVIIWFTYTHTYIWSTAISSYTYKHTISNHDLPEPADNTHSCYPISIKFYGNTVPSSPPCYCRSLHNLIREIKAKHSWELHCPKDDGSFSAAWTISVNLGQRHDLLNIRAPFGLFWAFGSTALQLECQQRIAITGCCLTVPRWAFVGGS